MFSMLLTDGYIHGFDPRPDSLDRALQAARHAVDTDLSNHKAHQSLAWALFFRKDFKASRIAAERTIALNPMDACATVYMAQTIALGGDWDRGCPLILRAMELNPNHPAARAAGDAQRGPLHEKAGGAKWQLMAGIFEKLSAYR